MSAEPRSILRLKEANDTHAARVSDVLELRRTHAVTTWHAGATEGARGRTSKDEAAEKETCVDGGGLLKGGHPRARALNPRYPLRFGDVAASWDGDGPR
jgi:hypothetical protein